MDLNTAALLAVLGDDTKAKETLRQILQATADSEAAQKAAQDEQGKAGDILREAEKVRQEGIDAKAAAETRNAEIDKREAELERVNTALTAEKAKFEEVRLSVGEDQDNREKRLTTREAAVSTRELELDAREKKVLAREDAVGASEASLAAKHKRLVVALADNEDEPHHDAEE